MGKQTRPTKPTRNQVQVDPFFQEVPWECIYNDIGQVIGEVYVLAWGIQEEGVKNENHGDRSRNKLRRLGNDGTRKTSQLRPSRLLQDKNA
ncbi:hypothetical protein D3C78_1207770 [compost metagenome]